MKYVFRFLILIIFALFGGLLYSLTINLLIMSNLIPTDTLSGAFGYDMTNKAVFVWMGSVLLAFLGIFTDAKWRYILLGLPVLLPSFYAILYGLSLS